MKLFSLFVVSVFIINIITACESATDRKPVTTSKPREEISQNSTTPGTQNNSVNRNNINPDVAKKIIAVIKENLDATEKKDRKRVLNTIHKNSPQRQSTINGIDFIFKQYNFHFNLDDIKVMQVVGDSAVVYFKQTTTPIGNQPGVSENTAEGLHYMKKEGNDWKIFTTRFLNTEYKKVQ